MGPEETLSPVRWAEPIAEAGLSRARVNVMEPAEDRLRDHLTF
jgi:hypothetical protein